MGSILQKLLNTLFSKNLELVILGIEGAGKTTFVNNLLGVDTIPTPTRGLKVNKVQKGSRAVSRFEDQSVGHRWSV